MNHSSRNATRVDRIATGAVFATTLLIVSVFASMAPAAAASAVGAAAGAASPSFAAHVSESDNCAQSPAAAAADGGASSPERNPLSRPAGRDLDRRP